MPEALGPGLILANKYELVRCLGKGGMGVVFEAVHKKIGQSVAIKFLRPDLSSDPEVVRRFEREAVIIGRLDSPYVVRVLDVDVMDDGTPYLVIELLHGRDLLREVADRLPPLSQFVDWMIQVTIAVSAAHEARVVHRDLKPSNVFLHGPDKVVRVLDFGVSKLVGGGEQDVTAASTLLGTPRYMAPEQLRGDPVDGRTDLWAIGVMMYRLLSGEHPFGGGEDQVPIATAMAILTHEPRPLAEVCPHLPPGLCEVIMSLLAKAPEQRPPSALLVADRLAPYSSGLITIPQGPRTLSKPPRELDASSSGSLIAVDVDTIANTSDTFTVASTVVVPALPSTPPLDTGMSTNDAGTHEPRIGAGRWAHVGGAILVALVVGSVAAYSSSQRARTAPTQATGHAASASVDPPPTDVGSVTTQLATDVGSSALPSEPAAKAASNASVRPPPTPSASTKRPPAIRRPVVPQPASSEPLFL